MMKFLMKKVATAAMATAAMLAMSAGSALAAPTFTINPGAILGNPLTLSPFSATFINGTTSELLHQTATGNTGTGWLNFTGFSNNGQPVLPFISGLGNDYGLYLTFTLTSTYIGGGTGNGTIGSNYAVSGLTFTVLADPGFPNSGPPNNSYTNADATIGPFGQEAIVGNTADDIVLAVGSIVSGVAGINAQGGAFLNSIETFGVCSGVGQARVGATIIAAPACTGNTGTSFFAAPNPFYSVAFDAFNNTAQGITRGVDALGRPTIGIQNAIGGVDFNRVPEPGSMALLGIALAGLGIARRGKNKATEAV